GPVHGPVVAAEHFDEVLRGAVAEAEEAALGAEGPRACAEQLPEARARAPQRGRLQPRRRRDVLGDGPEHLADEALGRPVRQADLAAGPAYAVQLGGGLVLGG